MISELRHKVLLCRQSDVITAMGAMVLQREGILETWAKIEEKKSSTFSPQGMAMMENRNVRSHKVSIRYRPDLEVNSYAWLYEERRISTPRWFRVLSVAETEHGGSRFFTFDARLTERGDDVLKPSTGPATGLPPGVML